MIVERMERFFPRETLKKRHRKQTLPNHLKEFQVYNFNKLTKKCQHSIVTYCFIFY